MTNHLAKIVNLSALLFICASALANTRPSVIVPKQENGKIITHPTEANPKPEPLRSMVSTKNLLNIERDTPFGPAKSKGGVPIGLSTQADTIRILALKIEFQTEDPDDPTTTGNGNLDLRPYEQFFAEEEHYFDPAPHNTSYFSTHLLALSRYWYFVSDRQLRLVWSVYPQADSAALRLPHSMSYYGSNGVQDSIVVGLERFYIDAVKLADSLMPELDFSRYQSIFLFHAGSDQQNNFAFINDTPNDLWTGFIFLADSVEVDSGRGSVREGLIMPETACQDNRITCLNAVVAHEFGHQLGLIDIYNTYNFLTQVGNFSLMDNNGMSIALDFGEGGRFVSGTMPVYPDAWSRAYLGFSGVTEITDSQNVSIKAAEQNYHNGELVKVPVSEYEYFLLENRQVEADFGYLNYPDYIPNALLADETTGVVLGPGYAYISLPDTVKVPTGEYDRLLPGDGMLIWHVDEAVAYMDYLGYGLNNFKMNTLQWDYNRRFLSLVEADGIIDFGGNYYTSYGTDDEYFKQGNNTAFTPTTNPNTHSNLGFDSHISITGIGPSDTIMTCGNITIDWYRAGFPVMGIPDLGNSGGLIAADINNTGQEDIITGGGRFIAALKANGTPLIESNYGLLLPRYDGDPLIYDWPLFANLDTSLTGKIAAGNFYGGDSLEIVCIDKANKIYFFAGFDQSPVDSLADLLASTILPDSVTAGPIVFDLNSDGYGEAIIGLGDGTMRMARLVNIDSVEITTLDSLGGVPLKIVIADSLVFATIYEQSSCLLYVGHRQNDTIVDYQLISLGAGDLGGLAAGDLNRDSIPDAVATAGSYLYIYDGSSRSLRTVSCENPGPPALGDIDEDGYPEIIFAGGLSYFKIYAYNLSGVLMDYFPVRLNIALTTSVRQKEPILADIDNDGKPDIIAALPDGGVTCHNYLGSKLNGFPVATSSRAIAPPIVIDLDDDDNLELAAADSDGFISIWDLGIAYNSIDLPWPMSNGGFGGNAYLPSSLNKPLQVTSGFLEENAVYNYPNPANNRTAFRYYVDRAASINVKIYDMTGELVDELSGSSAGGLDSEIPWNCAEFAPGVYFARFEAKAADRTKQVMIKVALIK